MKKPRTEKQRTASRINGQKSHGPDTPRGKSISSRNAIKHGFLAQSILLPGESSDRFLALKNTYLNQFQPQTQPEFDLVDSLVVNRWRLLRNWTLESISLAHEQRRQAETDTAADLPTHAMMAMRILQNPPRAQEALSRHEVRLDRQYYKALDRLNNVIADRVARENGKSSKQTWEVIENISHPAVTQPEAGPKEPRELPRENP